MTSRIAIVLLIAAVAAGPSRKAEALPEQGKIGDRAIMCVPGELLFGEDFDPATVSDRWWFRGEFALRDGALVRTAVNADRPNQRVFLKGAEFHNVIVEFSFQFDGETTDLRLVTGSDGNYNTILQFRPGHFQVSTAADKEAGIVPSHVGERARHFEPRRWAKVTVEFFGEEVVAQIDGILHDHIHGAHPIIDRMRTYFAFQFDRPGGRVDHVRIWKAERQRDDWAARRDLLQRAKKALHKTVERDPVDRYQYEYANVRSRLTRFDPKYGKLVKHHEQLVQALHADYPEAFRTHKELSKSVAETKKRLRNGNPEFKAMESGTHRARRAEDAYVVSKFPMLEQLPRHRLHSELGIRRFQLEEANDPKLEELVAETRRRQEVLEARFPGAFASVDALVAKRNATRKALDAQPAFRERNREVADAWQAIKAYELECEPRLRKWDEARKAFLDNGKPGTAAEPSLEGAP